MAFFWRKEAKQSFIVLTGRLFGDLGLWWWRRWWRTLHVEKSRSLEHEQYLSTGDNPDKCIQQFALKSIESWFSFFSPHSPRLKMESRHVLDKSSVGIRVGGADFNCRSGRSVLCDSRVPAVEKSGPIPACTNGPVLYAFVMDGGSAVEGESLKPPLKGNGLSSGGGILHDVEKVSGVRP